MVNRRGSIAGRRGGRGIISAGLPEFDSGEIWVPIFVEGDPSGPPVPKIVVSRLLNRLVTAPRPGLRLLRRRHAGTGGSALPVPVPAHAATPTRAKFYRPRCIWHDHSHSHPRHLGMDSQCEKSIIDVVDLVAWINAFLSISTFSISTFCHTFYSNTFNCSLLSRMHKLGTVISESFNFLWLWLLLKMETIFINFIFTVIQCYLIYIFLLSMRVWSDRIY